MCGFYQREANYPKAQYSKGVPRNFPKGGLPGDLPRAHPDIAQRPSNAGAHPQTPTKEGRPWPGPVGVLDLQLPTGACLRGVFWCAGKPACWAFDRTTKRCPGRSQRQPASSDTLGKRSRSWRAILPKYLSPRTTRLRALPPLPPGRPCPWPPSAPLNSMQAGLPEKFGGLTPRPGVWPRGRTASTPALLLQGDARDKTRHAST